MTRRGGARLSRGFVRDTCLCRIRHKHVYAASLIILSNCRNSVVSLTFCSLLRGIIRSHGKGVKIRQKPSNEVFPHLRGYKRSLFAILGIAKAPRIMPDICPSVDGTSYWNMPTFWQLFALCAA